MPRFDKLLVLDLDETLIHAVEVPLPRPCDFRVFDLHLYKRPGVDQFLQTCRHWFTVGVWSSSGSLYAEAIVDHLFGGLEQLAFVWSDSNCAHLYDPESGQPIAGKDLKKLTRRGFRKEHIIMIDDSPEKLAKNYGNGAIVTPFEGDQTDDELPLLLRFLETLGSIEDVRKVEKRGWREKVWALENG